MKRSQIIFYLLATLLFLNPILVTLIFRYAATKYLFFIWFVMILVATASFAKTFKVVANVRYYIFLFAILVISLVICFWDCVFSVKVLTGGLAGLIGGLNGALLIMSWVLASNLFFRRNEIEKSRRKQA